MKSKTLTEIDKVRTKQNIQWGGREHDAKVTKDEWAGKIRKQLHKFECSNDVPNGFLIDIAALAIAAYESQKGWKCECGTHNLDVKWCTGCGQEEPWICPTCNFKNEGVSVCRRCEKVEIWTCTNCNHKNIGYSVCKNCNLMRPRGAKNPCGEIPLEEPKEMSPEWQHALMHSLGIPHECGTVAPGAITPEQEKLIADLLFKQKKNKVFADRYAGKQLTFGMLYGRASESYIETVQRVLRALSPPPVDEPFVVDTSSIKS